MYCIDFTTGETVFSFPATPSANEVVLECFADHKLFRIKMERETGKWIARLLLTPGLWFYRVLVDGRARWDRGAGKLKTIDGSLCSFALIQKTAALSQAKSHPKSLKK
jgi:hypothetical protein